MILTKLPILHIKFTSQVSFWCFECTIIHSNGMEWLMNVTSKMKKVTSHETSLKSDSISICFEDRLGWFVCINRINIFLELTHTNKHILGVIDDIGEVVIIEVGRVVFFDIIWPNWSLNKWIWFSICEVCKCINKLGEFSQGIILLKLFHSVDGHLSNCHMADIPPGRHWHQTNTQNC